MSSFIWVFSVCCSIIVLYDICRGVVQLFNAVKKHQKTVDERIKEVGSSERKKSKILSSVTKKDFIDVLRGADVAHKPAIKKEKVVRLLFFPRTLTVFPRHMTRLSCFNSTWSQNVLYLPVWLLTITIFIIMQIELK